MTNMIYDFSIIEPNHDELKTFIEGLDLNILRINVDLLFVVYRFKLIN